MNTTSANELMMHRHVQAAPYAAAPQQQGGKQRAPGLPPTPPPPPAAASSHSSHGDVCMDETARGGLLPPRKAHRRSRSDVPFGYFQPLPPPLPKMEAGGGWALPGCGGAGDVDLLNAYMSLEGMGGADGLNNSDGDSRGSSMRTNGADSSENESEDYVGADSQALLWGGAGGGEAAGKKRRNNAAGETAARHARSLSMDSLMGKLSFAANGEPAKFSLEFGSGEFTPAEMKRIMADEKLAEMALADPKRVKRQSAARSKERRMRYIAELEQKVQILQTEATTLSAQLTLLQRDSSGMATQNNELKFRLQSMEQQAQLRDALNEALTAEVQRLKLAANEVGDTSSSSNLAHQIQLRCQNQMLDLHKQQQQQVEQIPFYQLEQPEQQNGTARNHESK
uniref:BZIP domain-containing protein n=1 Tax=Oryza glumipatula TaxID=40148 RepID=A0A0E0BD14_9ORYZ